MQSSWIIPVIIVAGLTLTLATVTGITVIGTHGMERGKDYTKKRQRHVIETHTFPEPEVVGLEYDRLRREFIDATDRARETKSHEDAVRALEAQTALEVYSHQHEEIIHPENARATARVREFIHWDENNPIKSKADIQMNESDAN